MSKQWLSNVLGFPIASVAFAMVAMSRSAMANDLLVATGPQLDVVRFAWPGVTNEQLIWPANGPLEHAADIAVGPDGMLYVPSLRIPPLSGSDIFRYFPNGGIDCSFRLPTTLSLTGSLAAPYFLEFSPIDGLLYVTFGHPGARSIIKIHVDTGRWWRVADGNFGGVNSRPYDLTFRPPGTTGLGNLVVADYANGTVEEWTVGTTPAPGNGNPCGALPVGSLVTAGLAVPGPATVLFAPDGTLLVCNYTGRNIVRYAATGGPPLATWLPSYPLGVLPHGMAIGPDGLLYVGTRGPSAQIDKWVVPAVPTANPPLPTLFATMPPTSDDTHGLVFRVDPIPEPGEIFCPVYAVDTCPCAAWGNGTSSPTHGCGNSVHNDLLADGSGALLTGYGSLYPDRLVLSVSGIPDGKLCVFLQSSNALAVPPPFGDGLRCLGLPVARMSIKLAADGHACFPEYGEPSITEWSASNGVPITPLTDRYYQVLYRDSPCPNNPWNSPWRNLSNGYLVRW